jgi:hypothetical protein
LHLARPQAFLQSSPRRRRLSQPTCSETNETLAAAQAANGQFKQAVEQQQNAIRIAAKLLWNTRLMEERLTSYRAGKLWTGDLFDVPAAEGLPPPDGKQLEHLCGTSHSKACEGRIPDAPKTPTGSRIPR